MKTSMLIGALALALAGTTAAVTAAQAADLKFAPGEDARFNWQSFEDFKAANDLSGQEMSLFGPWLSADKDLIESVTAYFEEATGAKVNYSAPIPSSNRSSSTRRPAVRRMSPSFRNRASPPTLPPKACSCRSAAIPLMDEGQLCSRSILGGSWHV